MAARNLTWVSLADQRPGREQSWLSAMPDTHVTVLSSRRVAAADVQWRPVTYRRPIRRFVEAGALAWVREIETVPSNADWIASLECCSLVTGQVADLVRTRPGTRQAVLTWENDPRQPLYRVPPYRGALRTTLRTASLFVCLIEAAADHLGVLGVERERIALVRPGVDLSRFRPPPTPTAEPAVLFVSPLGPNKGVDRVIEAMQIVRRTLPDATVRVMGTGPLAGLVRAAAADPSTGVRYLGAGDADQVASELRRAALFCTAPRANYKWSEQFGLAYLEAIASGLPVVTTATGTNHEAVPPGNIRTVDRADALAAGLIEMLADPARRSEVGAANRAYAEEHHDLVRQTGRLAAAFAAAEDRPSPC